MHTLYSLLSPVWLFWMIWTVVAVAVSWTIPGLWAVSKLKIKSASLEYVLATVVGLSMWATQGFVFGWLHLRFLTYGVLAISCWWWYRHRQHHLQRLSLLWQEIKAFPLWTWPVVGVGTLLQMLPVFGTGTLNNGTAVFYGVNAYDGMLHLAFIQNLARYFPPPQPGAVGFLITNYHYWSDLAMAELVRIWQLPIAVVFFQAMPLLVSLLTAAALSHLMWAWTKNKTAVFFTLFLQYAAGDLTYALYWLLHKQWLWDTSAIDNGVTQFLNIPHTFAKLVFVTALLTTWFWRQTSKRQWAVLSVILGASLVGFKVYYGMAFALGWALMMLSTWLPKAWKLWLATNKKHSLLTITGQWLSTTFWAARTDLLLTLLLAVAMLTIFVPVNKEAGGLFYSPLEWPKQFLGQNNLDFVGWWLRRQVYEAAGNLRGLLIMDGIAVAVGLLCVHGTRVLGFAPAWPLFKKWGFAYTSFVWAPIFVLSWLGLFTLQVSGSFNVFNFFVVTTIPLSLLTAWWLAMLWQHPWQVPKLVVLLVVALTLPRIGFEAERYAMMYPQQRIAEKVTPDQQMALHFLAEETPPDAVIQSSVVNKWDRITPYVAFFSGRQTYLTGVSMLESHNQPIKERQAALKKALAAPNAEELSNELSQLGIDYLYFTNDGEEKFPYTLESTRSKIVFRNSAATIIHILKPE